jgi:hypothetical protein
MKPILIILALVLAVGLAFWLFSGSAPAKPAGSGSASTSPGPVDGIGIELDAKVRVGLAARLEDFRNQLKQALAMDPVDPDLARTQLKSYDELAADVESGRQELATRGTTPAQWRSFLTAHHWDEIQSLAKELKSKLPAE